MNNLAKLYKDQIEHPERTQWLKEEDLYTDFSHVKVKFRDISHWFEKVKYKVRRFFKSLNAITGT
jgi:hypothetical protein